MSSKTIKKMTKLLRQAEKYDLPTRIAAYFVRWHQYEGGKGISGEEKWMELLEHGAFGSVPDFLSVSIHNAIRDIERALKEDEERGMLRLKDIPELI